MMRRTSISYFLVVFLNVGIIVSVVEVWAAEPTLARLSFWVPLERTAEFEVTYQKKVVPILKKHGLEEVTDKRKVLEEDKAWQEVLRDLGKPFGTAEEDVRIRHDFGVYSAPAGSGAIVSAGLGKRVAAGRGRGRWHTYDVMDGLADLTVSSIFQVSDSRGSGDRAGNLWFGTLGGVSR
jgi:hypothetical protein